MEIKEAIILAGGLGTRLRDAVPDFPKCMAPVAGRPFLFYVINTLRMQGIGKFIFSLGYKHEIVEAYLADQFASLNYQCTIETELLGTGGATRLACEKATEENVLVANGDTLFKIDLQEIAAIHETNKADVTLALKPMERFDRYGVVQVTDDGRVKEFLEKKYCEKGLINGGIYILNVPDFLNATQPGKFSFETEYLSTGARQLFGVAQDRYFIDIGIPSDYEQAQLDLFHPPLDLEVIDHQWTLFLDRDGVINVDKDGSYIFNTSEFIFMEGAPALFKELANRFGKIVIVTNQRGVGRGLMTEQALTEIHEKMVNEINAAGGRIDAIYYCTSTDNKDGHRKPNPGMARDAAMDFPDIDLSKALIVGNNLSDMRFGRNAGIYTVFVKTTRPNQELPHADIDLAYGSLKEFGEALVLK